MREVAKNSSDNGSRKQCSAKGQEDKFSMRAHAHVSTCKEGWRVLAKTWEATRRDSDGVKTKALIKQKEVI